MEREALAALERRVSEMRVVTAEKAVLARSLADRTPLRFGRELATAILAACVFAAFLFGREVGIFVAAGEPCGGVRPNEFVWIHMGAGSYSVTLDSDGTMIRDNGLETEHPGSIYAHVAPSTVREIANRLVKGCFFEKDPGYVHAADAGWIALTLRVGHRTKEFRHIAMDMPMPMCGGRDDLNDIESAIVRLSL